MSINHSFFQGCVGMAASLLFVCGGAPASGQAYKADIGFTALQTELGGSLPTGSNVKVTQVEADENGNATITAYQPNPANATFSGKTFTDKSAAFVTGPAVSSHATTVGTYLYGTTTSIAPGILSIDTYSAGHWVGSGSLNTYTGNGTVYAPAFETSDIQNHSWVGSTASAEYTRRLDFAINRDDFLSVMGLNNGSGTSVPELLAASYNGITVGLSDGGHSTGNTTLDQPGRVRPDIVAPMDATSWATPIVAGAGAVILDKAKATPALANATQSEVAKAILLAGATKTGEEFSASWDRTSTRPLDDHYGAGEVNVFNSYHILTGGEQSPGGSSNVALTGWDFATITASDLIYYFQVPVGKILQELSAIVTWNRQIAATVALTPALSNLDLRFFSAASFSLGTELDFSISNFDNVEHIYQTGLAAGQYALVVRKRSVGEPDADVGMAWRGTLDSAPIPEPSTAILILIFGCAHAVRRRAPGSQSQNRARRRGELL